MDYEQFFPSQYLKAADVTVPRVFTIQSAASETVGDEQAQKLVLRFSEDPRGLVANRTNAGMIAHFYGRDVTGWCGKRVELFSELVSFKGQVVPAIRVRLPGQPPQQPATVQALSPAAPAQVAAPPPITQQPQPAPAQVAPVQAQPAPHSEVTADLDDELPDFNA